MAKAGTSVTLFIDANQYLTLYEMLAGKRLLDSIEEQKNYIFVSEQIAQEVLRNKLDCSQRFFSQQFREVTEMASSMPDHLLGIPEAERTKLRNRFKDAKDARTELIKIAGDELERISRSEDDVSKRLVEIFASTVQASSDELRRAKERKERGNPPGKPNNPLGDQISWEQFLTHCGLKKIQRAWIITRDRDYYTKWGNRCLLNPFLTQELMHVRSAIEVHCFDNLLRGLENFGRNAGVKADRLPTATESAEIEREIEELPPVGMLNWDPAFTSHLKNEAFKFFLAKTAPTAGTVPFALSGPAIIKPTTTETIEE